MNERHGNGPQDLVTVSLCIQIAINLMRLCLLSVAYACPYHNLTSTMGHSVHNVDISTLLAHTMPYTWSGRTTKSSKMTGEATYGREINITFSVLRTGYYFIVYIMALCMSVIV